MGSVALMHKQLVGCDGQLVFTPADPTPPDDPPAYQLAWLHSVLDLLNTPAATVV